MEYRASEKNSCWTISPLLLSTAEVDKSQGLLYRDTGMKIDSGILAFLLRNGKDKILVDSGACGYVKTRQYLKYFNQTPEQTMEAQLAKFDTSPDEIIVVINTHLHIDHCAGNVFFGRAQFFVQQKELQYWKNPLRVHRHAYAVELQETAFGLLDGDADIASGVQVILTPGHSPGSQAVLVRTSEGLYILAGDSVPHFENMAVPDNESFWPSGIYVDLREYYKSLNRLKGLGGVILPGHDLLVLRKDIYP
jgi:N-acyl homoserine lactone hydrolase